MADEELVLPGEFRSRSLRDQRARFWSFVEPSGRCWLWTGPKQHGGYGHFSYPIAVNRQRQIGAHRLSWEMLYGPIPRGFHVCHSCDVPACVRPSHLWLGTDYDNAWDKMRKGRDNLDSRQWLNPRQIQSQWKLNPSKAAEIRTKAKMGVRIADLALEYGVSQSLIYLIIDGKRWNPSSRFITDG